MLTVLNVADPFAPVSREASAGSEQMLAAIDEALVSAGHRSLVLACRGSSVSGELLAVEGAEGAESASAEPARQRVLDAYRRALGQLLQQRRVDVVHLHGADAIRHLPETRAPTLLTLHLPLESYPRGLLQARRGLYLTCVSAAQRERCADELAIHATIEHGVDLTRFRGGSGAASGFALCLGRICREKGFDAALRAARRARVTMLLAGRVPQEVEHERYLAREIAPLLDQRRRFVGTISGGAKRRLLARARCVVVPSRGAETSSLVAMEALASGTPVLAFAASALSGIVDHGETGLIVRDEAELGAAFAEVRKIDRALCRERAERRFDLRRTTDQYLALYRGLRGRESALPVM